MTQIAIMVEVKSVYGTPMVYPKNQAAQYLASIAKTRTLTPVTLALAIRLGMAVYYTGDPLPMRQVEANVNALAKVAA